MLVGGFLLFIFVVFFQTSRGEQEGRIQSVDDTGQPTQDGQTDVD